MKADTVYTIALCVWSGVMALALRGMLVDLSAPAHYHRRRLGRWFAVSLMGLFRPHGGYQCRRRRRGVVVRDVRLCGALLRKGTRVYAPPGSKVMECDGDSLVTVFRYSPENAMYGMPVDSIRWTDPERPAATPPFLDALWRHFPECLQYAFQNRRGMCASRLDAFVCALRTCFDVYFEHLPVWRKLIQAAERRVARTACV